MTAISVKCELILKDQISSNDLACIIDHLRNDIEHGTFLSYYQNALPPGESQKFLRRNKDRLIFDDYTDIDIINRRIPFQYEIEAVSFDDPYIGLQRLVSLLCGDLFQREFTSNIRSTEYHVKEVNLSALTNLIEFYKLRSHSIRQVRNKLCSDDSNALLAFSIKPRAGLLESDYMHMIKEGLEGGCDLVEMDTRDFPRDPVKQIELIENLLRYTKEVSRDNGCRFSINFSGPYAHDVSQSYSDALHKARDICGDGPFIIKVDGSLDGLSTIQAIRRDPDLQGSGSPIITTFPTLTYALRPRLGRHTFIEMLSISGSDVIYPGGKPRLRERGGLDCDVNPDGALNWYERLMKTGRPMPTIAGGVHAGELHAYFAMFGPDVGYFVGGGISGATNGVKAGARACRKVLDKASDFYKRGIWNSEYFNNNLADICNVYSGAYEYRNPADSDDVNLPASCYRYRSK